MYGNIKSRKGKYNKSKEGKDMKCTRDSLMTAYSQGQDEQGIKNLKIMVDCFYKHDVDRTFEAFAEYAENNLDEFLANGAVIL